MRVETAFAVGKFFVKFAVLRSEGISRRSRKAAMAAIAQATRSVAEYDKQIDRALDDPRLSRPSKRFLKQLWYGKARGSALSLGNRAVHKASVIAAIITALVHAQSCRGARKGRTRFRMLTTSPDLGITCFDEPTLNVAAVCRHFDAAARAARVDALGFFDIALVDDRHTCEPLTLVAHVHSIMRGKDNSFRVAVAQRQASPRRVPMNRLCFPVAKIRGKKRDWGRSLSRSDVAGLGYYCPKPSCGLTLRDIDARGARRAKTTLHGWQVIHALRQLEAYSHCDALETTRGVGQGKHWRQHWKSTLLRLLKIQGGARGIKIDHPALEASWERIWNELGLAEMKVLKVVA